MRDPERAIESQKIFARILRGEIVPDHELPSGEPEYACVTCQDTSFVVETSFDGTRKSRRCVACRSRVDQETKRNSKRYVPGTEAIDDDPAPKPRDWKQAAGLDRGA